MAHRLTPQEGLGPVVPCPFCGEAALEIETHTGYRLICRACETYGPLGCTEEHAVCLWNARVEPSSRPGRGDARGG